MAEYLDVEAAKRRGGLRLVLSAGVPGPWGEAAKGLLHVKRIPYARVRQEPGEENPALEDWTGHANAPVAVFEDEPPRAGWAEIVLLAERLGPEPALVPADPAMRARLFGLLHEIAGEQGLGWSRRLMMLHAVLSHPKLAASPAGELVRRLGRRYGYDPAAAEAAPARSAQILALLAETLRASRERGGRYLLGDFSALDVYWATFAALVDPLPEAQCPMNAAMRAQYTVADPVVKAALDPELLAHRDFVYAEHLELPLDF